MFLSDLSEIIQLVLNPNVKGAVAEQAIVLAATKLRVGPVLPFDPKTETFVDNAKASAMLTREYRKPFEVPAAGKV